MSKLLAVLASGRGSNLQALIDAQRAGRLGAEIGVVVSDVPDAPALERARAAGIEAVHIEPAGAGRGRTGPEFDRRLLELLRSRGVDLVALAGFMRLLGPDVVAAYRWRILNVHPSLLPAFPGLHPVRRALEQGVRHTGCTIHLVDEGMDTGPIVLQQVVPVVDGDDEASLTARIQAAEHRLYPWAVRLLAEDRLQVVDGRVQIRGGAIPPWRRALISVSDKRGVPEFARRLQDLGWEIVSTGGTARILREAGVAVTPVDAVTGFPEILDGRVKTLHPAVHAGILARRGPREHLAALDRLGLAPIDLVCVNLYPFEDAVRSGATLDEALEQIDIGGPAMLRAAAKNHPDVIPLCSPEDYDEVAAALAAGGLSPDHRRRLAAKAFAHTAYYDAMIAAHLEAGAGQAAWAERTALPLVRTQTLRYGENPHQEAALYAGAPGPGSGLPAARQLQGKPLSYNNLLDAAAAWEAVLEFDRPAAVAVKHGTPCGIAVAGDARTAFQRARDADPVSIFGGIVAFNRRLDAAAAEAVADLFLEVVLAPGVDGEALAILARRKNLRVLEMDAAAGRRDGRLDAWRLRSVPGGLLVQSVDDARPDPGSWQAVAGTVPAELVPDLAFAWAAVKHVRSNAIVVARDGVTLGIGGGQPNRVLAARIALDHAGEAARGAVVASDAFLPFADTVELCARAGVAVIVQPGGSVRDDEVIAAAQRLGIAMVFTGVRHFRH